MEQSSTKPTHRKHNPWHDYSKRCIYHITIVVNDREGILGSLEGITQSGRIVTSAMHSEDRTRTSMEGDPVVDARRYLKRNASLVDDGNVIRKFLIVHNLLSVAKLINKLLHR